MSLPVHHSPSVSSNPTGGFSFALLAAVGLGWFWVVAGTVFLVSPSGPWETRMISFRLLGAFPLLVSLPACSSPFFWHSGLAAPKQTGLTGRW